MQCAGTFHVAMIPYMNMYNMPFFGQAALRRPSFFFFLAVSVAGKQMASTIHTMHVWIPSSVVRALSITSG